jgi:LytS/YehU family sensor histidine kinase
LLPLFSRLDKAPELAPAFALSDVASSVRGEHPGGRGDYVARDGGLAVVFGMPALRASGFGWVFPAIFIWSVTIFLWAAIYFGVHYFESYKTSEVEMLRLAVVAKDAQLRVLLAQVNPHFIFNCLNSLRALIIEDPPRAQSMVTELASMLRYSLQSGKTEAVSLETELEAVTAYLKLEAIRLEERLRIKIDMDPNSLDTRIPPMLLQTLVETV